MYVYTLSTFSYYEKFWKYVSTFLLIIQIVIIIKIEIKVRFPLNINYFLIIFYKNKEKKFNYINKITKRDQFYQKFYI